MKLGQNQIDMNDKSEKLAKIGNFMGLNFKNPMNYMYDKDWNKLIPVVKKIQQLRIVEEYRKLPVQAALMDVDIDNLFEAVAVFAVWYCEYQNWKNNE